MLLRASSEKVSGYVGIFGKKLDESYAESTSTRERIHTAYSGAKSIRHIQCRTGRDKAGQRFIQFQILMA
jgi:hypothetical protein